MIRKLNEIISINFHYNFDTYDTLALFDDANNLNLVCGNNATHIKLSFPKLIARYHEYEVYMVSNLFSTGSQELLTDNPVHELYNTACTGTPWMYLHSFTITKHCLNYLSLFETYQIVFDMSRDHTSSFESIMPAFPEKATRILEYFCFHLPDQIYFL